MADSKISALTAASALDGTEEYPVNQGGTSKKATAAQQAAYAASRISTNNAALSSVTGYAADTYLAGSGIAVPASALKAGTFYRCRFSVAKTAAGVATPIINLRFGTAGTTADASRGVLTFAAQTAATDDGLFEILATFRTVGSGTTAIIQSVGTLVHRLNTTGLATSATSVAKALTSPGFDSTVASSIIGLSVNGGSAASWTTELVQAELSNLA